MKKILFLLTLTSALLLGSCSDKNDKDYPLNGTTWTHNDVENEQVGTMKFQETTFSLNYTWLDKNGVQQTNGGSGTYSYSAPNLTMVANGQTLTAVIDGNTLTASNGGVFVKAN